MATLTSFADMAPVPRVLVDIPAVEFPAGAATVSLVREAEGRVFAVRGGQRLPASSPLVVVDVEAPFGVVSTYSVYGYDATGNMIGSLPVGAVTLLYDRPVVQQPLDARLSVEVRRLLTTAADVIRSTPGERVWPQGRSLPGLVGLGPRTGIQNLALDLFVATHADADRLQETLGTYETPQLPVWLVRTPPGMRIPRVFFCHVPEVNEVSINGHIGREYIQLSAVVTEVAPPAPDVTGAVLGYSDLAVFFATYSEVGAQYATYSDIKRDTSLIGAADA